MSLSNNDQSMSKESAGLGSANDNNQAAVTSSDGGAGYNLFDLLSDTMDEEGKSGDFNSKENLEGFSLEAQEEQIDKVISEAQVEAKFSDIKSDFSSDSNAIPEKEKQVDDLTKIEQQKSSLEEEYTKEVAKFTKLQAENDDLRQRLREWESMEADSQDIQKLRPELESMRSEQLSMESYLKNSLSEKDRLEQNLSMLNGKIEEVVSEREDSSPEVDSPPESIEIATTQSEGLQGTLSKLQSSAEETVNQQNLARETVSQLSAELLADRNEPSEIEGLEEVAQGQNENSDGAGEVLDEEYIAPEESVSYKLLFLICIIAGLVIGVVAMMISSI